MQTLEFNELVDYLEGKKVSFLVKEHYLDGKPTGGKSILGVNVTKEGRNFRANGKIISANMAKYFLKGGQ